MSSKIKYTFVLLFLLSITSLTLQGTILSCLKDDSVVKKQLSANNIPTSEEEEDETKTSVSEEETFLSSSSVFMLSANVLEVIWQKNTFLLCHNHETIQTPPPEA